MYLVYLDSCMVIYLVERHPQYASLIQKAMADHGDAVLCVSPLVRLEVLVRPMREQNTALIRRFQQYLATQHSLSIPDMAYDLALNLRKDHGLKTPDALHLATAQLYGCAEFWTNDDRLARIAPDIAINLLEA